MKLRKLLAVTAVAATMTAAFAVNAMAEETLKLYEGTDFTYDAEKGIITLTTNKQHTTDDPYTMLVVVNDEKPLETTGEIPSDTSFDDADIKQIDQADAPFTTINVGDLTAVSNCAECTANKAEKCSHTRTYEIRLGGDGDVRWGTLTIEPESTGSEYYDDGTRLLGDIYKDNVVALDDATTVMKQIVKFTYTRDDKDTIQAMDVYQDGVIALDDATTLMKHIVKSNPDIEGKTISEKSVFVDIEALFAE